jgi:GxxExxY protein
MRFQMADHILYKDECYQIQGAVFEVYREMGCGFLEAVYQECLEKEMKLRSIPFVAQSVLKLEYIRDRIAIRLLRRLRCCQ